MEECPSISITLISAQNGRQVWECDSCGKEIIVSKEMLKSFSSEMYIHIKREQPCSIPKAFYQAFADE